ncbi:glycosyltransferase, partial [bacterium]|nr:glycosyltransferase [bacterium]
VPFIFAETAFFLLLLMWVDILWKKRYHRRTGPPVTKEAYSVDVFIPVCREPLEIVSRTVLAALGIAYQNKTVYVLDDGDDALLKEFCESSGANYIKRSAHVNRKAGNLNFELGRSHGDMILTIDADQVARPEMIDEIIGYFSISKVGLVQTKQSYILPKDDPWGNSDEVFYDEMMPGKDQDNAAISCGNGAMYRRKALEDIGGFSTWNLVEDVQTSMELHDRGWTSVYHHEAYTEGIAPVEVVSQVKQRWQWSVDSLRMFFWDNPFFRKGLTFRQKVQYFHFGFNYIVFGVFLPIFFLIPIWALFSHGFMIQEPLWKYALIRAPYFTFYVIFNVMATEHTHKFKIFQVQAGLFAAYFDAILTALFNRRRIPQYKVTEKVALQTGFMSRLFMCLPHLLITILSVVAIAYGFVTIQDNAWFLMINIFWAVWTITVLGRFIILSLYPRLLVRWT